MNPAFCDFNFCSIWDPTLKSGPRWESLFRLVYEARQGHLPSKLELGDTLCCTLRPAAFAAYQQEHGPFAVANSEWFYSKLRLVFDVLLYERLVVLDETTPKRYFREVEEPWKEDGGFIDQGPHLTEEEIQEYLVPEDNERVNWVELVDVIAQAAPASRLATLRRWLSLQRSTRIQASRGSRSWTRNQERNQVILNGLGRGTHRERICAELDQSGMAVNLPVLEARGFQNWMTAWADPDGREAIQRLFSKLTARRDSVKSLIVSE